MKLKKIKLKIHGMHCNSCEILIERKFKKIPGVEKVNVHCSSGKAEVYSSKDIKLEEFQNAINDEKYSVSFWDDRDGIKQAEDTNGNFFQISTIFLVILFGYFFLKRLDLLPNLAISESMTYGFVFMIGLVAAVSSCIAVTGGLLLSLAAKYNERFPNLSGVEKFKPHIYFNIGRIVSYTLLGGLIGTLGSLFVISPRINGVLIIMISFVMISMGLRLLKLFPSLSFHIPMPKFLAHKIHDAVDSESKVAPFMLGAGTFFLPCGFTQALQLYVISQGDFKTGALTMFFFALGTLPSLLSLGAVSSFAKGETQKIFLKFAGVLVILLGILNLKSGMNLAGISLASIFRDNSNIENTMNAEQAEIVDGKQIVKMKVSGLDYSPSNFIITKGIPVEWQIDGREAGGCGQVITVPSLGITKYLLQDSITTIGFTPDKIGSIPFSCSMGMTTPGSAFEVIENEELESITFKEENSKTASVNKNIDELPEIVDGKQIVKMKVTGLEYNPNNFTVIKNIPVEWQIDGRETGGCAQVIMLPTLGITEFLSPDSITTITFTPKEIGEIPFSCSMGMTDPSASFKVIESPDNQKEASIKEENLQVDTQDKISNSGEVQKLSMGIYNDKGFYPNEFTVKNGIPIELIIDNQADNLGCMNIMVIPEYNVSQLLVSGKNTIAFTPTETGVVNAVCSMGILEVKFNVI